MKINDLLKKRESGESKVWGLGLNSTVVPFLRVKQLQGVIEIDDAALGAPLVVARDKDNNPKFNDSGLPRITVNKAIRKQIAGIRANFAQMLQDDTQEYLSDTANYEAYVAKADFQHKLGQSVIAQDKRDIIAAQVQQAQATIAPIPEEVAA